MSITFNFTHGEVPEMVPGEVPGEESYFTKNILPIVPKICAAIVNVEVYPNYVYACDELGSVHICSAVDGNKTTDDGDVLQGKFTVFIGQCVKAVEINNEVLEEPFVICTTNGEEIDFVDYEKIVLPEDIFELYDIASFLTTSEEDLFDDLIHKAVAAT